MRVSFIVPVFNAEKYIEKCIGSLFTQNLHINEFEVIAVNDGSEDESLKVLKVLKKAYGNLTILDTENAGAGSARNKGLHASTGDVIIFVDADDFLEPGCIGILLDIFNKKKLDILLFETIKVRNGRTIITASLFSGYNEVFTGECFLPRYLSDFGPCAKLYKRNLFFDNSLFFPEGIIPEDIGLIPKLILAANRVMASNIAGYNYTYNPDSVTKKHCKKNNSLRIDGLLYVAKSLNEYSLKYSKTNAQVYDYIQNIIIKKVILELFYFIEFRTHIKNENLRLIFSELKSSNLLPLKSANESNKKDYLFNHQALFIFCYFFRYKQIYYSVRSTIVRLKRSLIKS